MLTIASASSSEYVASLPRAKAADYWILGTLSKSKGLNKAITPALWRASIFWGLYANSATVWTKVTLAFW